MTESTEIRKSLVATNEELEKLEMKTESPSRSSKKSSPLVSNRKTKSPKASPLVSNRKTKVSKPSPKVSDRKTKSPEASPLVSNRKKSSKPSPKVSNRKSKSHAHSKSQSRSSIQKPASVQSLLNNYHTKVPTSRSRLSKSLHNRRTVPFDDDDEPRGLRSEELKKTGRHNPRRSKSTNDAAVAARPDSMKNLYVLPISYQRENPPTAAPSKPSSFRRSKAYSEEQQEKNELKKQLEKQKPPKSQKSNAKTSRRPKEDKSSSQLQSQDATTEDDKLTVTWKRTPSLHQKKRKKKTKKKKTEKQSGPAEDDTNSGSRPSRKLKSGKSVSRLSSMAKTSSCRKLLLKINQMNNDRLSTLERGGKDKQPVCSSGELSGSTLSTHQDVSDEESIDAFENEQPEPESEQLSSPLPTTSISDDRETETSQRKPCEGKGCPPQDETGKRRKPPRTRSAPLVRRNKNMNTVKAFLSAASNVKPSKTTDSENPSNDEPSVNTKDRVKAVSGRLLEGLFHKSWGKNLDVGNDAENKGDNEKDRRRRPPPRTRSDTALRRKPLKAKSSKYELMLSNHSIADSITMDPPPNGENDLGSDREDDTDDENSFSGDVDDGAEVQKAFGDLENQEESFFGQLQNLPSSNLDYQIKKTDSDEASEMISMASFHEPKRAVPDSQADVVIRKGRKNNNGKLNNLMSQENRSSCAVVEQSDDIISMADFAHFATDGQCSWYRVGEKQEEQTREIADVPKKTTKKKGSKKTQDPVCLQINFSELAEDGSGHISVRANKLTRRVNSRQLSPVRTE